MKFKNEPLPNMQDPTRFLTNGQLPRTNRERGVLLDQLRNHYITMSNKPTPPGPEADPHEDHNPYESPFPMPKPKPVR